MAESTSHFDRATNLLKKRAAQYPSTGYWPPAPEEVARAAVHAELAKAEAIRELAEAVRALAPAPLEEPPSVDLGAWLEMDSSRPRRRWL